MTIIVAKILLVEDEELLRNLYRRKLELANFEVEIAENGRDGLAKARESKPDLILLDIIMPGLNGIDALKEIKVDPDLKAIPVIMLTNVESIASKEECLGAGSTGYIIKSSSTPSDVLQQVKDILS